MGDLAAREITAVFVYGTLKQHESRGGRWPRPARRITPAFVWGELYDLRKYPALLPPQSSPPDRILGELWELAPEDLAETLRVLDRIEGYGDPGGDLYVRAVITVQTLGDHSANRQSQSGAQNGASLNMAQQSAFTYHYAHPQELRPEQRVVADDQGFCNWSANRHRS